MSVLKGKELSNAVTLLSTELNSLANNTNCSPSGAIDNTQGQADKDGYTRGKLEVYLDTYSGTPTANTGISVWFLLTVDGTNYEDGSSSVTPARPPDVFVPVRAVASGPQRMIKQCRVPVGSFKVLARNDGLGLALAASANTVKFKLNTDEAVA